MQLAAADRSGAASRDFLSLRHESWNHEITLHHAPIVKSSRATLPHLTRQVLIVCLVVQIYFGELQREIWIGFTHERKSLHGE
jgi:hypothetical protein